MNEAERLARAMFGIGEPDATDPFASGTRADHVHPDIEFSLFGMTGTKEVYRGREKYSEFVARCQAALADRSDEILSIEGIDEQSVFIRARAWRKSAATGEEIRYEWAVLQRVENGQITYSTDMLDRDAQEFWGRILGQEAH